MAVYNINSQLKGPKFVLNSEKAATQGSSAITPLVVCAFDSGSMQADQSSLVTRTSTSAFAVIGVLSASVSTNQYVGKYAKVVSGSVTDSLLIVAHTSGNAGDAVTFTVDSQYASTVGMSGTLTIRNWKDFNEVQLFSSVGGVADTFMARNSIGEFDWTGGTNGSANVFYSLTELKANGAALFYVLPVANQASAASLATNLAPTGNSVFLASMRALAPQPDVIVCPKQDFGAVMSTTNWQSVDNAWKSFVTSWAEDDTVNPLLTEILYLTDAGDVASTSAAVSFRNTTLNWTGNTGARTNLTHGRYYVDSVAERGQRKDVAASIAYAGLMNKISTGAPESFGHAFSGLNYAQVETAQGLVEKLTPANRISLQAAGINALIRNPGRGTYFENQFTQKKVPTSDGSDPYESWHVMVTRSKIKNTLQPIMDSITDEPNTQVNRARIVTQATRFLDALKRQAIIVDYVFADVTTRN